MSAADQQAQRADMKPKVRLNLFLSKTLYEDIVAIAESTGVTIADIIRCGVALLKVAHEGKRDGLHLGICDNPTSLDREIVWLN